MSSSVTILITCNMLGAATCSLNIMSEMHLVFNSLSKNWLHRRTTKCSIMVYFLNWFWIDESLSHAWLLLKISDAVLWSPWLTLKFCTSCVIASPTQVLLLSDIMIPSKRHDGGYLNTARASHNDRKTHWNIMADGWKRKKYHHLEGDEHLEETEPKINITLSFDLLFHGNYPRQSD